MDLAAAVQCADTLTVSAHKVGGLRGASVLVVREPSSLRPLVVGGSQERGLRAGTVSPSLAAATSLAIRLAVEEWSMRAERMRAARAAFADALGNDLPGRCLTPEHSVPNTSMYLFRGVDGRNLLPALDMAGVEASQGSACSSGAPSPPRVLAAMGLCELDARACVRFSFSHTTSTDEAARAGDITRGVVQRLLAAHALAPR
jgi:cysteine desulfurase